MVRLCLTGDVMTGRGIDQALAHPGDPTIHEPWLRSARDYLDLAERRFGPIPRPLTPERLWGVVLPVVRDTPLDAFVVNLETAVTDANDPWPGKGIHYRMHPRNVGYLTTAGIDVAALANNHVLDWSRPGLAQTLDTLHAAGIATVGAGPALDEAQRPALVPRPTGNRTIVLAAASTTSGVPPDWEAGPHRSGVALLPDLSDDRRAAQEVERIARLVEVTARPGDVVVMSLHWGENWVRRIPEAHRRFARALIDDAGVHVVHGHSSHHALGIEVHRGHLILYGCGDLLTDYEGITGHEEYRGDLGALYLPVLDAATGALRSLHVVPTTIRSFQLVQPGAEDREWLAGSLTQQGVPFGTAVEEADDGTLGLRW